ncbi:MAG: hypothetical protein GY765_38755 [bacterium]|nr:hypothetical protein [bacterium]
MKTIPIRWIPKEPPLPLHGLFAGGPALEPLVKRLLRCPEKDRLLLRGVCGEDFIVLLGPDSILPWVEGLIYLGRYKEAPGLYLPTLRVPAVDAALVVEALEAVGMKLPALLLEKPAIRISLAKMRPPARSRLTGYITK